MYKKELFWAIVSLGLILLAYVIPYTFLSEVAKWYGSFLLWIVIALLIIGVNVMLTRNWRS